MSSRSNRAASDVEAAVRELDRHRGKGLRFRTVERALGFYFERGALMGAPRRAVEGGLQVDGGGGGDHHEVLAVCLTIGQALGALAHDDPVALHAIELRFRDGRAVRQVADRLKVSSATASAAIGRGEAYVIAWLRWAGVMPPRRRVA